MLRQALDFTKFLAARQYAQMPGVLRLVFTDMLFFSHTLPPEEIKTALFPRWLCHDDVFNPVVRVKFDGKALAGTVPAHIDIIAPAVINPRQKP